MRGDLRRDFCYRGRQDDSLSAQDDNPMVMAFLITLRFCVSAVKKSEIANLKSTILTISIISPRIGCIRITSFFPEPWFISGHKFYPLYPF